MKRTGVALVLVALLISAAACGGGKAPAAPPEKAAATVQGNEASAAQPAKATEAPLAPEATEPKAPAADATVESASSDQGSGGDSIQLADEETALKGLNSYKTTWSFEWTGKSQDGKEQIVKWLSAESYSANPPASYTKFEGNDSLQPGEGGAIEFYQIGNKSYMVTQQDGKPQCTAFTSEDNKPSGSMLNRSAFGSISSGQLVGEETINGVATKHYKYDEKATGMKMFTKLTGDVWVATDGDYVVKDVAEWEGSLFGMLAGGSASDVGKGSWKQEVTDINKSFAITPPEGCENAAEDLPMMADASEQASFGAMTTYKTASKLADVAKFYQDEMPKAGWTAEDNSTVSDQYASLSFAKDGKKANVILTTEDTNTAVMITVE